MTIGWAIAALLHGLLFAVCCNYFSKRKGGCGRMTREGAIKILSNRDGHGIPSGYNGGYAEAIEVAIEALKAEPIKHGRWLIYNILDYAKRPTGRKVAECSVCGQLTPDFRLITEEPNWNYCPNCGAKMDLTE